MSTGTVGATGRAALLHAHDENGEEHYEQTDHDGEQGPHDQMVHVLAWLRLHMLIHLWSSNKKKTRLIKTDARIYTEIKLLREGKSMGVGGVKKWNNRAEGGYGHPAEKRL